MSILRDERLVALHDLVEACRASARHCALVAESLPEESRAGALEALAAQRNREADFFGERMLAEDDIPEGPPEERSLLQSALARGKAALAGDAEETLLADCRAREEEVLSRAEAARRAPLRGDEKAAASALAEDARRRLDGVLKL
ncbi:hypothetical protein AAFN88_19010 [Pelagibius sp. CAU 1746]|uniref:hypothetical protein n=1 Tax=Pelagibius sp. CAU 1746 TaxID=3140370 RepID=UPI00325B1BA0